jgi:hypothetical protein
MMTRKDYVRTAEILNDHLVSLSPTDINGSRNIYDTAKDFAEYFAEDNPRFDEKRFMQAVRGN